MAPVAAEIIAGRPPRKAIETAIVNDAKRPTRGSTPAMIENEIASGISASATTRPASSSVRSSLGERNACITEGSGGGVRVAVDPGVGVDMLLSKRYGGRLSTPRSSQPDGWCGSTSATDQGSVRTCARGVTPDVKGPD